MSTFKALLFTYLFAMTVIGVMYLAGCDAIDTGNDTPPEPPPIISPP